MENKENVAARKVKRWYIDKCTNCSPSPVTMVKEDGAKYVEYYCANHPAGRMIEWKHIRDETFPEWCLLEDAK